MAIKRYFFFYFLLPLSVLAQTNADYQKKFQAGKQQMADGKYTQARETFRTLLKPSPANAYAAYAHYYSALAALKSKQPGEAKQLLTQLSAQFPNWKAADEARYLQANIAFEEHNETEALRLLKTIHGKGLESDVAGMKKHYLGQVKEVATLKRLQSTYSDDPVVAAALVQKLRTASASKEDKALAERLRKQFKLDADDEAEETTEAGTAQASNPAPKAAYNVALMLPFATHTLSTPASSRDNQFVLDMYQGMKLAKEKLAEEGINVNLLAYDVANEGGKALELVNSPEFKSVDMIFGPLYAESNKAVSAFSAAKGIPLINPISYNQKILQDNPYSYLVQTSPQVRAAKAAEYAARHFLPNTAMIFYGNREEDSLMAFAYRDKVKELGGKVLVFKKMNTPQFGTSLQSLKNGSIGHVFISTANQSVAATLMSELAVADSQVPIITNPNFLDFQMIKYDQYERRNVHFIYPEFASMASDSVKTFTGRYINQYNTVPSVYAYQGYDMMVFFGQMLSRYGTQLSAELRRQPRVKAMTLAGFDYSGSNANQYVPLLKFVQARLVPVNQTE